MKWNNPTSEDTIQTTYYEAGQEATKTHLSCVLSPAMGSLRGRNCPVPALTIFPEDKVPAPALWSVLGHLLFNQTDVHVEYPAHQPSACVANIHLGGRASRFTRLKGRAPMASSCPAADIVVVWGGGGGGEDSKYMSQNHSQDVLIILRSVLWRNFLQTACNRFQATASDKANQANWWCGVTCCGPWPAPFPTTLPPIPGGLV